jgi:hypothetical protein
VNNTGDWSDQVVHKVMPTLCMNRGQSTGHVDGNFASPPASDKTGDTPLK